MLLAVSVVPPDVDIQRQLTSIHIDEWLREDVFQFRWWFLLAVLFVSVFVWWKMIDKSRLPEIVLYASIAIIAVMAIGEYGDELTLWDYPTDIIPIFPPLTSINLLILPLVYSIVYQYFKTFKRYIWANLIITAIICFVMEPILAWGGFYELIKWQYYFSYPIYVVTAIFIRVLVINVNIITENYKIN